MKNNTVSIKTKSSLFILGSAFFYGTYGIWSRLMSESFGEFSQAWSRGLLLLIVILIINAKFKLFKPITRKDLPWFLLIAVAGGLNQAPYFFGFKYLNIGTATLIFYAALLIGGYIIGKFVFEEQLTTVKWISLLVALVGMLVIYKLVLNTDQLLAAGLTTLAGLMGACAAVLPKKLSSEYAEFQIMSGYFIVMVIANFIIGFFMRDPLPNITLHPVAWAAQLSYATAMLLANWAVIEGFKHIDASIGSLIGLAEILFGIFFGTFFFHETIGVGTLIGSMLIIISAALPNILRPHNTLT